MVHLQKELVKRRDSIPGRYFSAILVSGGPPDFGGSLTGRLEGKKHRPEEESLNS